MPVKAETAQALVDGVFALGRALRSVVAASGETQIAPALTSVLFALEARGECRQNELAADLCVSQSSLSRQISELVAGGYVLRATDPDDKRASRIRVSPKGIETLKETAERRAERLRSMLESWSQEQALAAVASLAQLNDTFGAPARRRTPPPVQPLPHVGGSPVDG
ncbi:MarR family transcriptional regulator [Rhodococcus sp. WMMA185]|uniref:MarR family winged helix-turn-helix transcriptional regulator n=1 Tax=Rhodococcus sp. WMMA185 TaxID=679318 RepID=UPI000878AF9B|nr:MarR family winged helix-turn-helix transcriptional regulator [Rhodococcus sp. WMMA185]AOW94538.1 MarR family transcriptional regulator [Rhodococcus sp. WMMA185]